MNKKLGLAVAGAVLALSSAAQAGITIPAGDWTLDIGGNVNAYYTNTTLSGDKGAGRGGYFGAFGTANSTGNNAEQNITTGLLPTVLSVSGKTRQNDLDVAFTISIQPGVSTQQSGIQGGGVGAANSQSQENRQAFLTFGDASWGSVKLGKDLGIYASDAILNDMTLLGVGAGAGGLAGNTTTLGRIGTGFQYADWIAQVAYTTPNFNGLQATIGLTQAWNARDLLTGDALSAASAISTGRGGSRPAVEGKASYSWAGDFSGKVWTSFKTQKVRDLATVVGTNDPVALDKDQTATAYDLGATVGYGNLNLVGYMFKGTGAGSTMWLVDGFDATGKKRDSNGYYMQATYVIPTNTKLGMSYGRTTLQNNSGSDVLTSDIKDSMWTIGAYHPLTKSLNLVAEYSQVQQEYGNTEAKAKTVSAGAILFF